MKLLAASAIVAAGLAIAGFFIGGRYTMLPTSTNAVTRLDRFTGAVSMCIPGTKDGCDFTLDAPKSTH